jgi:transposase
MATLQKRKSHGQTYWYIVESRRVNGKPRPITLAYLGKAEDLLQRLAGKRCFELQSFSHGDTAALLKVALDLDIVRILNKYIQPGKNNKKPKRDNLTVGATLLLAALGRACCPTSKDGWYEWCKTTSLEYCLQRSFRMLNSQHFWDQMDAFPVEKIPEIEEEIVQALIRKYDVSFDTLLFDTTNFFTFINSANKRCELPQRGKNKQRRADLRQLGLALLVTRKDHLPLFHKTYRGNKPDSKLWHDEFFALTKRLQTVATQLSDVTLVFDKGNNSKENFRLLDNMENFHYVASLIPSYFKALLEQANRNFAFLDLKAGSEQEEQVQVYRTLAHIWGKERTCVILISEQLREGQIRGIHQTLEKKYAELEEFKSQLENPRRRKSFNQTAINKHLSSIVQGQYISEILRYNICTTKETLSFTYSLDASALQSLKDSVLGRRLLITNQHDWSTEEIILAYRAQTKVEYAFRNLKNPYHLAVRPQFHWTDQKLETHFFICVLAYLLVTTTYAHAKNKGGYSKNIDSFLDDLRTVRLGALIANRRISYQLEKLPKELHPLVAALNISDQNLRPKINFSVYN